MQRAPAVVSIYPLQDMAASRPTGNAYKPIEITVEVHIMRKKEEIRQEKEKIMKTIGAISNCNRRGVIKMKNLQRHGWTKKSGHDHVTAKHLDQWKKIVVQEVLKFIPQEWRIFEFCSQSQDAEYLYCHVTPASRPITFEYYLHTLSIDSCTRVVRDFDQALAILIRTNGDEYSECQAPPIALPYSAVKNHAHSDPTHGKNSKLHLHNFRRKLVGANADRGKGKDEDASCEGNQLTRIIEDVLSNLIGALANSKGGTIAIEDADHICQLLDGRVCAKDQDVITRCLEECCNKKIWGRDKVSPKRDEHWDIQFPIVDQDKIIFTVRVDAFYGGVFERKPEAYTLKEDEEGSYRVIEVDFEDWIEAMLKQHRQGKNW